MENLGLECGLHLSNPPHDLLLNVLVLGLLPLIGLEVLLDLVAHVEVYAVCYFVLRGFEDFGLQGLVL